MLGGHVLSFSPNSIPIVAPYNLQVGDDTMAENNHSEIVSCFDCAVEKLATKRLRVAGSDLMVTEVAARELHCSPRTLEAMRRKSGGPRFKKCGRKVLYARADLMAWLDARSFASTSEAKRAGVT